MRITEEDIEKQKLAQAGESEAAAEKTEPENKRKSRDRDTDFKDLAFKGKLQYLWDYYKWVLVVIVAVVFLISVIKEAVVSSKKVEFLHLAMVDAVVDASDVTGAGAQEKLDQLQQDILTILGEQDNPNAVVGVDTNLYTDDTGKALDYQSTMVFTVKVSAQEYDIVLYPKDVFDNYQEKSEVFLNMDDFIPQAERQKAGQYLDYGILLDDVSYFTEHDIAFSTDMVLTVVLNSKNQESAKQLVQKMGY